MDVWNDFFKDAKDIVTVHCEGCASKLLEYPKGLIHVPSLPLTCTDCGNTQTHYVQGQTKMKVVA